MDVASFSLWRFEPLPLGLTLIIAVIYGLGIGPLRAYLNRRQAFPLKQAVLFYSGLAILSLMFISPLHTLGEFYLVSAHMLTLMTVIFVVAPLVLAGLPGWLIAPVALQPSLRPLVKFLTRPSVNVIHFNLAFAVLHVPVVLKTLMFSNEWLHYYSYFVVFGAAVLMWWPILNPLPEALPSPGPKGKVAYLLVMILAHNPFSAVLSFYPGLLYPWYAEAPRVMGISPMLDQQTAGVVMGSIYLVGMLSALAVVFLRWFHASAVTPVPTDIKPGLLGEG